jgi:hypothetical protein
MTKKNALHARRTKLTLSTERLRDLSPEDLRQIAGGSSAVCASLAHPDPCARSLPTR